MYRDIDSLAHAVLRTPLAVQGFDPATDWINRKIEQQAIDAEAAIWNYAEDKSSPEHRRQYAQQTLERVRTHRTPK